MLIFLMFKKVSGDIDVFYIINQMEGCANRKTVSRYEPSQ